MGSTGLYIVPTPIGNRGDITLRALDVLKRVDRVIVEDTRTSGLLLKHFGISKPLQSFHLANEHASVPGIISRLKSGESAALITDAGTPGISDPGFLLVRACLENDVQVECLPGATAFVPALVKSGLPCDRFLFEGFLPQKKGRQAAISRVADCDCTVVLYESPHRLVKTLEQLCSAAGPVRRVSVSRELTKLHEETYNGTLAGALAHFSGKQVRGEIVIVLDGKKD